MKKLIPFIVLFCLSFSAFSQNVLQAIQQSTTFFDLLDNKKFAEATELFDAETKTKITKDDLELFWLRITNQLGTLDAVDRASSKREKEYLVVSLNCKFQRGVQGFQFVYDKDSKIAGFFATPGTLQMVYAQPAYADTTAYKETLSTVNSPGHQLAAMVTVPKSGTNFPIVVMVHGSGPSDMDETVGPNKPFKDLALGLATQGIASVRYVKRTLVYSGEFNKAFTVKEEVVDDALAAIEYAKTIPGVDKTQIYVLGHSLGGMLAPKIATLSPGIKGIVLAAAPARKFADLLVEQNKYVYGLSKDTTGAAKKQLAEILAKLEQVRFTTLGDRKPDSLVIGLPASYWADLNQYDQVAAIKKLTKRVLVVQGGFDFQVATTDYDLWKAALSGKPSASFKFYPTVNHLLSVQTEKGTQSQYGIQANVSAQLVTDLAAWIKAGTPKVLPVKAATKK